MAQLGSTGVGIYRANVSHVNADRLKKKREGKIYT